MAEIQDIVIKDVRLKIGTKLAWAVVNPLLLRGQPGYEVDSTGDVFKQKVGDGTRHWNDLPYLAGSDGSGGGGLDPELQAILEEMADRYQGEMLWSAFALPIYTPTLDGPPVPTNMIHPANRKRMWQRLVSIPKPSSINVWSYSATVFSEGEEYFVIACRGRAGDNSGQFSYVFPNENCPVRMDVGSNPRVGWTTSENWYILNLTQLWALVGFTRTQDEPIPEDQDPFIGGNGEVITRGPAGADGITLDVDDPRVIEHNAAIGDIVVHYGLTPPPGTLDCDGSMLALEDFPDLGNFLIEVNPALDALDGEHFYLPDMRNQFLRGTNGSGRLVGTHQQDALQNITGDITILSIYEASIHANGAHAVSTGPSNDYTGGVPQTRTSTIISFDASRVARTAGETRPENVAVRFCIRYKASILAGVPGGSGGNMAWPPDDSQMYGAYNSAWEPSVVEG